MHKYMCARLSLVSACSQLVAQAVASSELQWRVLTSLKLAVGPAVTFHGGKEPCCSKDTCY